MVAEGGGRGKFFVQLLDIYALINFARCHQQITLEMSTPEQIGVKTWQANFSIL